jgi:multisubunit Na+/H+ antiporter MnhG subunit
MYTKRQLSILALILGTIGLCLFLLEKMHIVKTKVVNYIGKALIAVGIYLLAIANIITD